MSSNEAAIKEARTKVSISTDACLTARAKVEGIDKAVLMRQILDEWAAAQIHNARVMNFMLINEGLPGVHVERRAKQRMN